MSRLRFQFSLRAIFVLTAVVAAGVTIAVHYPVVGFWLLLLLMIFFLYLVEFWLLHVLFGRPKRGSDRSESAPFRSAPEE